MKHLARYRVPVAVLAIYPITVVALALLPLTAAADNRPFLPKTVVTSTVPENGDVNPYGVAIVPPGFPLGGTIAPGDVLVSNFNNSDGLQGTGTTIIKYTPNDGVVSPAGQAFEFFKGSVPGLTTALGVLKRGFVLVGSVSTTDGKFATIQAGPLLFLDRSGNVIPPSPFTTKLDGPWDLTIDDEFDHAKVFVSNVLNGTVTRLDLAITASTITVKAATVIASGYTSEENDAALILGPTGLAYDPQADVLFVASTADNMIFAVPNAGTRTGSSGRGAIVFKDDHLRGPLALVFAPDGDLLTANGDAVNDDPTPAERDRGIHQKGPLRPPV
jgi:DNA-binding beta-propeller fold protein YncE